MGATRNNSDGMKNYYNISYGKLSAQEKTQPNNFTEITEVELKSKTQNCENLDLRNRYVFKEGKERPYIVFYDEITGAIRSIEKKEFEQGINLQIELLDSDLETSIIQSKFYSKYTENILNRLLNCDLSLNITLRPYSMPADFDLNGQKKKPRAHIICQPSLCSGMPSGGHEALHLTGYSGFRRLIGLSVGGLVGDFLNIGFGLKKPSPVRWFATP